MRQNCLPLLLGTDSFSHSTCVSTVVDRSSYSSSTVGCANHYLNMAEFLRKRRVGSLEVAPKAERSEPILPSFDAVAPPVETVITSPPLNVRAPHGRGWFKDLVRMDYTWGWDLWHPTQPPEDLKGYAAEWLSEHFRWGTATEWNTKAFEVDLTCWDMPSGLGEAKNSYADGAWKALNNYNRGVATLVNQLLPLDIDEEPGQFMLYAHVAISNAQREEMIISDFRDFIAKCDGFKVGALPRGFEDFAEVAASRGIVVDTCDSDNDCMLVAYSTYAGIAITRAMISDYAELDPKVDAPFVLDLRSGNALDYTTLKRLLDTILADHNVAKPIVEQVYDVGGLVNSAHKHFARDKDLKLIYVLRQRQNNKVAHAFAVQKRIIDDPVLPLPPTPPVEAVQRKRCYDGLTPGAIVGTGIIYSLKNGVGLNYYEYNSLTGSVKNVTPCDGDVVSVSGCLRDINVGNYDWRAELSTLTLAFETGVERLVEVGKVGNVLAPRSFRAWALGHLQTKEDSRFIENVFYSSANDWIKTNFNEKKKVFVGVKDGNLMDTTELLQHTYRTYVRCAVIAQPSYVVVEPKPPVKKVGLIKSCCGIILATILTLLFSMAIMQYSNKKEVVVPRSDVFNRFKVGGAGKKKRCGCNHAQFCAAHSVAKKCGYCGRLTPKTGCFCRLKRNNLMAGVVENSIKLVSTTAWLITPILLTMAMICFPAPATMRRNAWITAPTVEIAREHVFRGLYLNGIGVLGAIPVKTANTTNNLTNALRCRALAQTREPDRRVCRRLSRFYTKNFRLLFPGYGSPHAVGRQEWLSNFKPCQRAELEKAFTEIDHGQVSLNEKHIWKVTAHTKIEKLNKWNEVTGSVDISDKFCRYGVKASYAPRAIQAFTPWANCFLGPYIRGQQRRLKAVWDDKHFIRFGTGRDAIGVGKLFTFDGKLVPFDTFVLEDDFKLYDSTQGKEMFRLFNNFLIRTGIKANRVAHYAYTKLFTTFGRTRAGHSYYTPYTVKSGACTTTLQNSWVNGLVHAFALCEAFDKSVDWVSQNFIIVVNGDDNVIVDVNGLLKAEHKHKIEETLVGLGLTPKLKERTLGTMTFCASNLLRTDVGDVATPTLGRVLPKLLWSTSEQSDPDAWCRGVLAGTRNVVSVTPFHQELYEHYGSPSCAPLQPNRQWMCQSNLTVSAVERARYLCDRGINEADCIEFRRVLRLVGLHGLVITPALAHLCEADN